MEPQFPGMFRWIFGNLFDMSQWCCSRWRICHGQQCSHYQWRMIGFIVPANCLIVQSPISIRSNMPRIIKVVANFLFRVALLLLLELVIVLHINRILVVVLGHQHMMVVMVVDLVQRVVLVMDGRVPGTVESVLLFKNGLWGLLGPVAVQSQRLIHLVFGREGWWWRCWICCWKILEESKIIAMGLMNCGAKV